MNIFKNKLFFTLLITLSTFTLVKAQSDFRPGYIITKEGDTINGLINLNRDKENAKVCIFKKNTDLEKVTHKPN